LGILFSEAQVINVSAVSITVDSMDKEIGFFKDILEFKLVHDSVFTDPEYV
jgi:catechol 2,3-dioxygenase-like lactoylglutathione lyase family enzyme